MASETNGDETTTIRLRYVTKARLDREKIIPDETYDSEIIRLLDEADARDRAEGSA